MSFEVRRLALIAIVCLWMTLLGSTVHAQVISIENGGFEKKHKTHSHPSAWTYYTWSKAPKVEGAIALTDTFKYAGQSSCQVQAVGTGAQGIISRKGDIPALGEASGGGYLQCTVWFKTSKDYVGNRPWLFIAWHDAEGQYLGKSDIKHMVGVDKGFKQMGVSIARAQFPKGATTFAINLATSRQGSGRFRGSLYFDDVFVEMTDKPLAAAGVQDLVGTQKAKKKTKDPFAHADWIKPQTQFSWWSFGDVVTYRADDAQDVPLHLGQLRGIIYDVDQKQIDQVIVSRDTLISKGWNWTPSQPGLYEVEFTWEPTDAGTSWKPIYRQYSLKNRVTGNSNVFKVPKWAFAVAARPTRPMNQRSGQFGVSVQYDGTDVPLADLVGMRFARIHAIGWGAQYTKEELGIELKQGEFNWDRIDTFVDHLNEFGFEIMGNIIYTPRWASPHPDKDEINICVREFSAYAPVDMNHWSDFVAACVKRYKKDIKIWELWNEPNIPGASVFWNDTPENYYRLLKAGYEAVKKYQPDGIVCIGGLGPRSSYLAFYNQLLKLGGGAYFDRLALHGSDVSTKPFYALDKAYDVSPKPWFNTEWHAMLYTSTSPESATLPDEKQVTQKMFMDLLQQIKGGVQKLTYFATTGNIDREAMAFCRKDKWSVHWSGLFRTRPLHEPRFAAVVLQHFFSTVQKKGLTFRKGIELEHQQQAAWFDNSDRPLMVLWATGDEPEKVDLRISELITASTIVTQWDGKAVSLDQGRFTINPGTIYFLENIDVQKASLLEASENVLINPRDIQNQLQEKIVGKFQTGPLFETVESALRPAVVWQNKDMEYFALVGGSTKAKGFTAMFAVGMTPAYLDVAIRVTDKKFVNTSQKVGYWFGDSVQFALDPDGTALAGNHVEFIAALDNGKPILMKTVTPYLGGDLPSAYTQANEVVKHAQIAIDRESPDTLLYKIRINLSELYPFVLNSAKPLRFSLLVNNNDGHGRSGYLQWAAGIGKSKQSASFGTLKPQD